jgi:hypothetical protein
MDDQPNYRVPEGDVLQGDIYLDLPSIHIEDLPLRVARYWRTQAPRQVYAVHTVGDLAPKDGFKWSLEAGGEPGTLVNGYMTMGIVLSHDCTIENSDGHRTVAMVRPITDIANLDDRQPILDYERTAAFPLLAQDANPRIALSFVDFRRITTVRPTVLAKASRYAQCSDRIRDALAEHFWDFLFREYREPRAPRGEGDR